VVWQDRMAAARRQVVDEIVTTGRAPGAAEQVLGFPLAGHHLAGILWTADSLPNEDVHAEADDDRPLLRYRDGRPITVRRYDYLWNRVGEHLPWAARQGITAHWLRHTTLTWVERNFGYAVARAYAGHEGGLAGAGVTATYVRADLDEVAAALAALTAEAHPLAHTTAGASSGPTIGSLPTWW
jgi:hypothetical protein